MRVKNKEIRRRRHRKEIKIKDAAREIRAMYAEKKPASPVAAPKKPVAKKPVAEKKATKPASE